MPSVMISFNYIQTRNGIIIYSVEVTHPWPSLERYSRILIYQPYHFITLRNCQCFSTGCFKAASYQPDLLKFKYQSHKTTNTNLTKPKEKIYKQQTHLSVSKRLVEKLVVSKHPGIIHYHMGYYILPGDQGKRNRSR